MRETPGFGAISAAGEAPGPGPHLLPAADGGPNSDAEAGAPLRGGGAAKDVEAAGRQPQPAGGLLLRDIDSLGEVCAPDINSMRSILLW
ncbi:unnamed protein product [Effrenium voratum]|nr:unnamed protein product [Effrenium voratum]